MRSNNRYNSLRDQDYINGQNRDVENRGNSGNSETIESNGNSGNSGSS